MSGPATPPDEVDEAAEAPSAARLRRARRYRLPAHVRPTRVDLHLDVDPTRPSFFGRVEMEVELERGSRSLTLHAAELRPLRSRISAGDAAWTPEIEVDPLREVMTLRLPESAPRGSARVEIEYEGRIRDDLEGLYGVDCHGRRFAFSQLCTTRARTLFPCFDEPGFKARYSVSATAPASDEVVSNMPVAETRVLADGRKLVRFEPTPPLSTYLLALAVGELEISRSVYAGSTEIRVVTTPGKGALTELALDVARRALPVLEAWFDIPYPYAKLDLVAVPDFSFGAMENAGAVFFRETLLLADPERLRFDERKRLTETICHELAHMWFGNLVTMAWWDDLWLNESFATWMAFHVVSEIEPEWHTWQTFQHRKDAALDLDALAHTHPVYVPVASAEEANENFDLITYEKGASIIRMLAGYLGPDVFRAGVRRYVAAHAESNARAADLWAALEAETDVPVARIMRTWIERAGHPHLRVERAERDGQAVFVLGQALHRTVATPSKEGTDDAPWPVPVIAHVGGEAAGDDREVRLLVDAAEATLPATGFSWIHANGGEAGFYRPWPGEAEAAALRGVLHRLPAIERQGLVGHGWAGVQAALVPIGSWLALLESLHDEPDADVLQAVAAPVAALARGLVHDLAPGTSDAFRSWVESTWGTAFDAIGAQPREGETSAERRRRAELFALVGAVAARSDLVEAAADQAIRVLDGVPGLDPELAPGWLMLAARHGDVALYERCLEALQQAPTPQARQHALFALTEFARPDLAERTLDRCATGQVASQDLVFVLGRCLAHPDVQRRTWTFITQRWDELARQLPGQHAPRLIAATPALRTSDHRRAVTRFFRDLGLPSTRRAIQQATERFAACEQLRAHAGAALEEWLAR